MATSIIYLVIDHDTAAEENEGTPITPESLRKQGEFVNEDAAGIYGYEGWNTIFDADHKLLALMADAARKKS